MDPVTTVVTATALKVGVERAISAALSAMSSGGTSRFRIWRSRGALLQAADKLHHIRMVKTIWQIDRAVDLTDFYYQSKLVIDDARVPVCRLDDIPVSGNIVVQGTVGQGKSIFLRHFTVIAALDGERLPLFIELRRLQASETLEEHIRSELKILGLPTDEEGFAELANSGRFLLLLDAFDEVREERREKLIQELESFSRIYSNLRMVATTRPGSGIERSAPWTVYTLAPLADQEYEKVIERICHDEQTASSIIAGLNSSGRRIAGLLTTPLMVAMLVLRYRADQSIPENQVAFFSDLFTLLLQRHDKTKAGYVRQRKSGIGDKALERLFVAICFLTRKKGESAFSGQQLYDITKQALSVADITAAEDDVLDDIRSITCLLLEEGGEYRFIHKIVQEYHAACFISHEPDASAETFYKAMQTKWRFWQQELDFLETMDAYRCLKFFVVPMYGYLFADNDELGRSLLILGEITVGLAHQDDATPKSPGSVSIASVGGNTAAPQSGWIVGRYMRIEVSFEVFKRFPFEELSPDDALRLPIDPGWYVKGSDFAERDVLRARFLSFAQELAQYMTPDMLNAKRIIEVTEQRRNLMNF